MPGAHFRVVHAGPHTTVQDAGRPGFMRYGVPSSGPMDRASFEIANAVLGNAPDTPALETSLGGLSLECVSGSVTAAVVGGGFCVRIGESDLGSWTVFTIESGQTIAIRPGPWGSWTYLAIAGRLAAQEWLGSVSTHSQSGFGGGRLLAGMDLTVADTRMENDRIGAVVCPVFARPRHVMRLVLGPQERFFPTATIEALLSEGFRLSDSYDRMGVRLTGPRLAPEGALAIPSEAVVRGSIQVSGDGVASVLLADHQTTGGYPKIATIVSADLDGFVQLRPRATVAFQRVSPLEAITLTRRGMRARELYLHSLRKS